MPLNPSFITEARLFNAKRWGPEISGLAGWTADPYNAQAGGTSPVAGSTHLGGFVAAARGGTGAVAVNTVFLWVDTAGVGLTSSQCFAGLYNSAGQLLAQSADLSGVLNSTGLKTITLTPVAGGTVYLSEGQVYYIALLQNFGTSGARCQGGFIQGSVTNLGSLGGRFQRTTGTSTTLPAQLGAVQNADTDWFAAVGYV